MTDDLPPRPEDPFEAIKALEAHLSLPEEFYDSLLEDSDWSFIVKLHSLIEAAVSGLLTQALGQDELYDTVSRLELSDKTTGKIAFLKALGLLDRDCRRFVYELSELRNKFVHDISKVSITLAQYVDEPEKLKAFTNAFDLGIERVEFDDRHLSNEQYMKENPKEFIWWLGLLCLAVIYVQTLNRIHIRVLKTRKERKLGQLEGLTLALARLGIDTRGITDGLE